MLVASTLLPGSSEKTMINFLDLGLPSSLNLLLVQAHQIEGQKGLKPWATLLAPNMAIDQHNCPL